MKRLSAAVVAGAFGTLSALVHAQAMVGPNVYAESNEAVGKDASGNRKVELPPHSVDRSGKPQIVNPTPMPVNGASFVYMIETNERLLECSHISVRDDECQPSTIGTKVRTRMWVVKRSGKWWVCAGPKRNAECNDPPAYNGGKGTFTLHMPTVEM